MDIGELVAAVKTVAQKLSWNREEDNPDTDAIILYPSLSAPAHCRTWQAVTAVPAVRTQTLQPLPRELRQEGKAPKTMKIINTSLKIHACVGRY